MRNRVRIAVLSLMMAGIAYACIIGESFGDQETVGDWKAFFPKGSSLAPVKGLKKGEEAYEVRAKDGGLLGWVFRTDRVDPEVKGVIDQSGILVAISKDRKIIGVKLVEFRDTPDYGKKLTDVFYRQFKGRTVGGSGEEIDTVTGATMSSKGIARDVFLSSQRLFSAIDSPNTGLGK